MLIPWLWSLIKLINIKRNHDDLKDFVIPWQEKEFTKAYVKNNHKEILRALIFLWIAVTWYKQCISDILTESKETKPNTTVLIK